MACCSSLAETKMGYARQARILSRDGRRSLLQADGLLFGCLADQNPFSLRWIVTLCVVEAHRYRSPNWLPQYIGLLVVSVSTDGRTIDKDRGEGWRPAPRLRSGRLPVSPFLPALSAGGTHVAFRTGHAFNLGKRLKLRSSRGNDHESKDVSQ